jgi:hypothetical protein
MGLAATDRRSCNQASCADPAVGNDLPLPRQYCSFLLGGHGRIHHQRQHETFDSHAFKSNRRNECVRMPRKTARSGSQTPPGRSGMSGAIHPLASGLATRPMAGCALLSATAGAPRWLCSLSPLRPFTMMEAVSASSWRAGGRLRGLRRRQSQPGTVSEPAQSRCRDYHDAPVGRANDGRIQLPN